MPQRRVDERRWSGFDHHESVDEIRGHVGATSLHYLTLDGLQASTGLPQSQFCRACFDGDYPIAVPEEYSMCKMRFEKGVAAAFEP